MDMLSILDGGLTVERFLAVGGGVIVIAMAFFIFRAKAKRQGMSMWQASLTGIAVGLILDSAMLNFIFGVERGLVYNMAFAMFLGVTLFALNLTAIPLTEFVAHSIFHSKRPSGFITTRLMKYMGRTTTVSLAVAVLVIVEFISIFVTAPAAFNGINQKAERTNEAISKRVQAEEARIGKAKAEVGLAKAKEAKAAQSNAKVREIQKKYGWVLAKTDNCASPGKYKTICRNYNNALSGYSTADSNQARVDSKQVEMTSLQSQAELLESQRMTMEVPFIAWLITKHKGLPDSDTQDAETKAKVRDEAQMYTSFLFPVVMEVTSIALTFILVAMFGTSMFDKKPTQPATTSVATPRKEKRSVVDSLTEKVLGSSSSSTPSTNELTDNKGKDSAKASQDTVEPRTIYDALKQSSKASKSDKGLGKKDLDKLFSTWQSEAEQPLLVSKLHKALSRSVVDDYIASDNPYIRVDDSGKQNKYFLRGSTKNAPGAQEQSA